MLGNRRQGWMFAVVLALVLALTGCASNGPNWAPVSDRSAGATGASATAGASAAVTPLPGAENAGKPGYYTVRPGDTIMRIGLDTGQSWRDLARWNNLADPNVIEVGQVLRVIPPAGESVAVAKPVTSSSVVPVTPAPAAGASAPKAPAVAAIAPNPAPAPIPTPAPGSDDDISWAWPTRGGSLLAGFDEAKNKGIDIGGKAGDPVLAAADGRVVYAGAGLRGYGNLVILKHNNMYLTAYAHNQTLLVKEDQTVRKGQEIAKMGSSDADRVKLHFEIRRQGKPVDPTKYLPPR
ncbi:MAG: LysM peptidoglycan-binding domain-containing protein [Burkholderiaceae bacterium]|nr:MAG: LysM peptidoglycan-binding domain-containing protein [Burkholderiaceae bacterium]